MRSYEHLHVRYTERKKHYTKKILGELEALVECPLDEWEEREFDKVFDMLRDLDNEVQGANDQYELNRKEKECILCGKMTTGSVGKAGLRIGFICQPCRDAEDKALEHRLDSMGRDMMRIVKGIDAFGQWLKAEEKEDV
jgi:hypothetical protein